MENIRIPRLIPWSFQWALNGAGYQPGSNPPKACTDSSASAVGGRYAVCIFGGSYCQWSLLHFHDGDIRLARKCCGLRNIRPMASSSINGGLLGTTVWHDVHPTSESVANSDGPVRCGIHCLRCNVSILRCCISPSGAVYAACAQSERRGSQRRKDRPGGIRYYWITGEESYQVSLVLLSSYLTCR